MIQVRGNDLWRGGQKIGYVQGHKIYSHEGKEVGFVDASRVYRVGSNKPLAYLEGDYIRDATRPDHKIRIEDNHQHVSGGEISDAHRAAVRMLLGD